MRAALEGAGYFANNSLTRDDDEAEAGVYLLDNQDADGIAKPVASLMARHATPGVMNPDLADALAAAVALAIYCSKQLGKLRDLRRARTAGLLPVDHTVPAEQDPAAA